ncbi:hypothetical protein FOT49_13830, partial [Citrobacter freundii]|nr:hypothetical protein [Citrobacter freundii]
MVVNHFRFWHTIVFFKRRKCVNAYSRRFAGGVFPNKGKRPARTVLTGMRYSIGSATRQGSSSLTR